MTERINPSTRQLSRSVCKLLRKMCKMVGADYYTTDFKADTWYWNHTWTPNQERAFREWMIDELVLSTDMQKDLFRTTTKRTLKWIEQAADEWIWNYGWKVEEDV